MRPIQLELGPDRFRLSPAGSDLGRAPSPLELRAILRALTTEEAPWRGSRLRELSEALGVTLPARGSSSSSEARRRALTDELLARLTRPGGPVLLREPPTRFDRRSAGDEEVEDTPFEESDTDTEWIEVQLVDEENQPVSGVRYRIELSDHRVRTGKTNENGVIRYDRIPGGTCKLSFPDLDQDAWDRA